MFFGVTISVVSVKRLVNELLHDMFVEGSVVGHVPWLVLHSVDHIDPIRALSTRPLMPYWPLP